MANYQGTTTSEGGKVTNVEEVQKIINKYTFGSEGELNVELNGEQIEIYGYEEPYAYTTPKDGDEIDFDTELFDAFMEEIAPYIKDYFVVSSCGSEKCRYIQAYAYVIKNNELHFVNLENEITKIITD